ncbi:MFS/sugar transport protein [Ruminococcaceae bacterium YRB3002]|nr:MFS/sugar transport protein [Ruminococcaceae bacterium YRB3002]
MGERKKLSGLEKFAYGIGAVGKDMVYMLSASYVLYYFQDIMGVSAIAMGVILLIARVFDAFNDPIMGVIVAKTKTRWGKFRPWLLIGTVTNAVVLAVMFAAPPTLDGKGLVAYAAITYILWGITYTMMDIPYWSMVPAFTDSGKERENLSALARSCAGVGSAIVTIITVMAVAAIGGALADKRTNASTVAFDSASNGIMTYVVEIDENGNPTSTMKEYETSSLTVNIEAAEKFFNGVEVADPSTDEIYEGVINISSSNADISYTIGDVSAAEGEGNAAFYIDKKDGTSSLLVIYADAEKYAKLSSMSELTGTVTMHSRLEVERVGFGFFAIIIGVLFIVFTLITCIVIKEKSSVEMKTATVGQMFKALIQNDQAMAIVVTIVLINIAVYITSNLLIYFFKYDLGGSNWQGNYTLFNMFIGGVQIIAMMLFFPLLRRKFKALRIFYMSVGSAVAGYGILLVMSLLGVTSVYMFFIPGFFIMAAVGLLNVLVTVFLANTVDYGEYKNHRRDESVIFSMQTFVVKLASGIAALIASVSLAAFDIQEDSKGFMTVSMMIGELKDLVTGAGTAIDDMSVIGLRLVMTLTPIFVLVVAMLLFRRKYILNDRKLDEINEELKKR